MLDAPLRATICDRAVVGVVVIFWSWCGIDIGIRLGLAVFKQWVANSCRAANKTDTAATCPVDVGAFNDNLVISLVHKNRIATNLIEFTVDYVAVLCIFESDSTSAIDRPITTE